VAALVELLGIACTGSPALALGMALDKHLAKVVFEGHGIRTPAHIVATPQDGCPGWQHLQFPLIVKPLTEDASIGIDDGAVVDDAAAMLARVHHVWREHGQPALVEEFIDGREFNVSLLARPGGDFEVLPIGEIRFDTLPAGRRRVLDYDAKWNPGATFRQSDAALCPAPLDTVAAGRMARSAIAAATVLGARDYVRVELRQRDTDGELFVIEVNPNPDLSDGCEFLRSARAAGIGNDTTILRIAACAAARIDSRHEDHDRNDPTASSPAQAVRHTARQR
jgi:D-alanine-D-alanine ligase